MDVGVVLDHVRGQHPDVPVVLVGHSQGGLIALSYVLDHPRDVTGAIVSSPFLGIHPSVRPSPPLKLAARILSVIAPKLRLPNNVNPEHLSRDPDVAPAYSSDPLTSDKVSARWFTSIVAAHRLVLAQAPSLSVPALVMQSGADRLVDAAATRAWVDAAPRVLVEYVEWDGYYHEMFNEPEGERLRVFERMERWLADRLG